MKRLLFVSMLIAVMAPAFAITPSNVPRASGESTATPPPKPPSVNSNASSAIKPPSVSPADAKRHADDSSGMRRGVVQNVNVQNGTFHVFGQSISFDPKQVRVIGADGKQTSIYSLRQGANVRFTLDPTDPTHRRAAVIYVN